MEGYVFDDRDCRNPDGTIDYKKKPTNHIILLAKTQEGLKNIYKLVSYSHLQYFYKRPRLPKSVIQEHREGLIIGSACEAGEVYRAIVEKKSREEIEKIASFYDYILEIQPLINNQFMIDNGIVSGKEELREINRQIIKLADDLEKPVVATTDAHYRRAGIGHLPEHPDGRHGIQRRRERPRPVHADHRRDDGGVQLSGGRDRLPGGYREYQ